MDPASIRLMIRCATAVALTAMTPDWLLAAVATPLSCSIAIAAIRSPEAARAVAMALRSLFTPPSDDRYGSDDDTSGEPGT